MMSFESNKFNVPNPHSAFCRLVKERNLDSNHTRARFTDDLAERSSECAGSDLNRPTRVCGREISGIGAAFIHSIHPLH